MGVNERVSQLRPFMDEQDVAVVDVLSCSVVQIPLLMDPYDVTCVATSRLPHRRGPTLDMKVPMTRIVLNCDFTSSSEEEVDKIGFIDDDAATSKSTNCISYQNVVDDLHSEIVIRVVSSHGNPPATPQHLSIVLHNLGAVIRDMFVACCLCVRSFWCELFSQPCSARK